MPGKVLITGASGLLGTAAAESFLDAGWEVIGVSRRKPELPSGREITSISVDLRDAEASRAAFEPLTGVTHIAYAAIYEKADLVAGWSSADQIETNNTMLRNTVEPITRNATDFRHVSILQGTKVYGVHLHPIPIPARESDPRDEHDNFFLDQEDYVREAGTRLGFSWTALRPQLVTGAVPGALNVLPAIGAYAAIQHEKGERFGFPGGPSFTWEAADAGLVADVMVWAAESPEATDTAFNITNGDVFEWRNAWPGLAKTLGVEPGPDTPMSLADYLAENEDVWNRIVAKYGLRQLSLHQLVGAGDQHADFAFAYGAPAGPTAFVSTVKLRQAGFTRVLDTEEAFQEGLQSLIERKYLPPATTAGA